MSASSLLASWLATEPMAAFAMGLAVLLFLTTSVSRIGSAAPARYNRIWQVATLILQTAAFLSLLWGLYFLLNNSGNKFSGVLTDLISGGATGREQTRQKNTDWGGWFTQTELSVQQFVEKESVREISQEAGQPLLYLKEKHLEPLNQENITAFEGQIQFHLVDPQLATYTAQAEYVYEVANPTEFETLTEFSFHLLPDHRYENLSVAVNGQPPAWKIDGGRLIWEQTLQPQQTCRVKISYDLRSASSFSYAVPNSRAIRNYSLTLITDSTAIEAISNLETTALQYKISTNALQGYTINWKIDRAIMAPRVGIQFIQPPQPVLSTTILDIFPPAARALVLLLSLITITLVICGVEVEFWRLGLVGGLFAAQFLGVQAIYPTVGNYFWPILIFGGMALIFDRLILRNLPRLPLSLGLILIIIFGMIYPFSGLLPGERERNALDGAVQVGMIIYIFGLTLYTRVRNQLPAVKP